MDRPQQSLRLRLGRVACDYRTARFLQREVQSLEHIGHRLRKLLQPGGERSQTLFRRLSELPAIGDFAQFKQSQDGDGIARRLGAVVILLDAQDEVFGVRATLPESTVFGVIESGKVARTPK